MSREGKIYTTETVEVFDHDFPSLAEGVAVPHTVYDEARNEAYVTIGTSRDTSEFACDSLRGWWYSYGILYYANATSILMLMDGGGSNSSRHSIKIGMIIAAWCKTYCLATNLKIKVFNFYYFRKSTYFNISISDCF